ncbi:kinase-like domain-containing protein [Hyaloraphidium curvatum]|nr:kinase-like domain-containing protein [Hyaloraphidium curvatum]
MMLDRNPALADLDLESNSIGYEGASALAEALEGNPAVAILHLGSNRVADEGACALAEALKCNSTLTGLWLSRNSIGDPGAIALAGALSRNSALTDLDLHANSIGHEGARALAEALKDNSTLARLNLRSNSIGDEGARAILSAIELNPSLKGISLDDNGISRALLEQIERDVGDPGRSERAKKKRLDAEAERRRKIAPPKEDDAAYWRELLAGQRVLAAGCRLIGDTGARALAEALGGASMLGLVLHNNHIGDAGARALAGALMVSTALKDLDMGSNSIGDEGASAIAESLKGCSALTHLNLYNNSIAAEGARALASALKAHPALTRLILESNSIGPGGALALADAIRENSVLVTLDLRRNAIGDDGARALLSALELSTSLEELLLADNGISGALRDRIAAAVGDPGRKQRAMRKRREIAAERLREAERAKEEQQAARQRQREADEAETRRKQQRLEDEARARQAQEREAELARRLEELRFREEEVERKMAEAEERAKQARGDSGYEPPITPRPATKPTSPDLEQGQHLGAGAFGTVTAGSYQKHTKVAIKMIRDSNLSGRQLEGAIAGLEREMEVWSRLPYHVNVLPLMGWCREPLCLVTLLMPGGTAKKYLAGLKPKAYEPRAVHRLLFQVALGMNHLHSRPTPILHLDLKGDNVLVDENGVAKISDFGMSKIRATAALHSTQRSGGTAVFMAPEAFARPRAKPGTATDVYAFGMTMWELLSQGDLPLFDELMDEDLLIPGHGVDMEAFGERLRSDPRFRPERPRGIPDATWALMQRCWAFDAAARPAFGEVADELKSILDSF